MSFKPGLAFTVVMLVIVATMVGVAAQYPPDSRFMPWVVGIPAVVLCLLQIALELRARRSPENGSTDSGAGGNEAPGMLRREAAMWGFFVALVAGILLFGFLVAVPLFVLVFLRVWARASWPLALGLVAAACVILYLVFVQGLNVALHRGFVTEALLERFYYD